MDSVDLSLPLSRPLSGKLSVLYGGGDSVPANAMRDADGNPMRDAAGNYILNAPN